MAQFGNRPDNANERKTSQDILKRRGRQTVSLIRRLQSVDQFGDITYTQDTPVTRRCNLIHLAADEVQEQVKQVEIGTHWISVRAVTGLDTTWEAEYNGETYGIVSVQDIDGLKRIQHIRLKKVD